MGQLEVSTWVSTIQLFISENMSSNQEIEVGSFAPTGRLFRPGSPILVVDWNIDRGLQLGGIIDFLASTNADLILLQEVDFNARRTHKIDVAQEISRKLQLNYIFGREFQELTQGTRISPAFHGQATLSPWPLSNPRILRFRRQSNFWRPRWFLPNIEPFQERIGGRMALVCDVSIGGRTLVTYNLHLESRGDDGLRCSQLNETLSDALRYKSITPILLAGDLNLEVSLSMAANALRQAQFLSTAPKETVRTTPPRSLFDRARAIDWIFTRGSIRAAGLRIHNSVSASDHYPLSVRLAFIYRSVKPDRDSISTAREASS
ncbi:endonuclease/exonuclease/phosphatase family protein [Edaphobacter aggregans]|uniref:endonuclease/exonuclease/phosphatase family protein n=1 Tax=Edaphobacter aggregans TaxID=570835 RepID=UPI0005591F28